MQSDCSERTAPRASPLRRYAEQIKSEGFCPWLLRKFTLTCQKIVAKPLKQTRNLGLRRWLVFSFRRSAEFLIPTCPGRKTEFKLYPGLGLPPVYARHGTSDILAFSQVFAERQYSCIDDVAEPKLIIDCGANVGYSSL